MQRKYDFSNADVSEIASVLVDQHHIVELSAVNFDDGSGSDTLMYSLTVYELDAPRAPLEVSADFHENAALIVDQLYADYTRALKEYIAYQMTLIRDAELVEIGSSTARATHPRVYLAEMPAAK